MNWRHAIGFIAVSILILANLGNAISAPASTPGAIQQIEGPPEMQFQYDQASDRSIFTLPGKTQIVVSVIPPFDAMPVLVEILKAYGADQYIPAAKPDRISGREAASVTAKLQSSNWWVVIKGDDLNLFVQVEDAGDATSSRATVETLLKTIRFTPPSYPPQVVGEYSTGSHYSGDVQSSIGVYSESGITLAAGGEIISDGLTSITGTGVSGYSAGEGQDGWWQVRGNRLLAYYPPNTFYNYRFQVFSNGLEIYPPQGETLLWPRK